MESRTKGHIKFLRFALIFVISSLVIASAAISFMCYKLSNSLLHTRNIEQIEVTLEPKEFPYEEVQFKSKKDDTTLKGVFFRSKPQSNKTIIIVPGFNQNRMLGGRTNTIAEYFVPKGYNILAFDLRGEGTSEGDLITFGYYEKYDVMGAIDYSKQRGKEGEKIALLGFSMGAVTAIEAAEKDVRVDAVIADSPFRDLKLFAFNELTALSNDTSVITDNLEGLPYLPVLYHLPFKDKIMSIVVKLYGINIEEVSPMNAAKSLSAKPVFLIHGEKDKLIPCVNSEEIYKSLKNNPHAKLWITESANHLESLDMYTEEYLENIETFLDKSM